MNKQGDPALDTAISWEQLHRHVRSKQWSQLHQHCNWSHFGRIAVHRRKRSYPAQWEWGIFKYLGNFFSDCGGSCQGRASLSELAPGAFANTEAQLHKQSALMSAIDLLSGAHKPGSQWKDSNGYVHMLQTLRAKWKCTSRGIRPASMFNSSFFTWLHDQGCRQWPRSGREKHALAVKKNCLLALLLSTASCWGKARTRCP